MEALRPSRSTASLVAVLDVSLWFHTHCQCRSPSLRSSSLGRSNTYLDEDEVRAGLGEPHGHGLADAARAAGDDGRVALEGEERRRHWGFFCCCSGPPSRGLVEGASNAQQLRWEEGRRK